MRRDKKKHKKTILKQVDYTRFWDHSYGPHSSKGPIVCEALGFVIDEDGVFLYLAPWVCNDEADNDNNEVFCIVKSCIISRTTIKKFK